MKKFMIPLSFVVCLIAAYANAAIVDAPHNETHGISCGDCHSYSLWWQFTPTAGNLNPDRGGAADAICAKCHGQTPSPQYPTAPYKVAHSSLAMGAAHNNTLGSWQTNCVACHDPHFQAQLDWATANANDLYLVQGTIGGAGTFVAGSGTTTFNYLVTGGGDPQWAPTSTWVNKTGVETGAGRSLVLVDNMATADNTYQVVAATAATITVKGTVASTSAGHSFGLIYGQLVKSSIAAPPSGSVKTVKFFNPKKSFTVGAFTDSNSPAQGLCQVCHTKTSHWLQDGTLANHNVSTPCSSCHVAKDGFKPPAATPDHSLANVLDTPLCVTCHPVKDPMAIHKSLCSSCHIATVAPVSFQNPTDRKYVTAISKGECIQCHTAYFNGHTHTHHAAAANRTPAVEPATLSCGSCHAAGLSAISTYHLGLGAVKRGQINGAGTVGSTITCATCHSSTATAVVDAIAAAKGTGGRTVICSDCHGVRAATHPAEVMPAHTFLTKSATGCVVCHDQGGVKDIVLDIHKGKCANCHDASTFALRGGPNGDATLAPTGGTCTDCHGAYFVRHTTINHATRVGGAAVCVSCHTATAGTATTVPVDATPGTKVHDGCATCHDVTAGTLRAAYGKASAMPAGGGDCTACHGAAYFDSHTHSHDVTHNPAIDLAQGAPGTACRNCHDDANLGKGTLALSTWAAIKAEHLDACATCHGYTNADGKNSPPLTATQNAITSGTAVTCITCHTEKISPATHGGHTAADFGYAGNCNTCHTGADIVATVHKGNCGDCHVNPAGGGTLKSLALGHLRTDTCTTCHTDKATSFFNHTVAHASRVTGDATCTGCHTATAGTATTIPLSTSDNKVHDDCATCHVEATGALRTPYGKATTIALGSCVTCHGAYFSSHVNINHTTRVAATTDCVTCHTATAGTATSVPVSGADNKVHDNCAVCHDANGGLKAAYGKASAMPAGGGDCVACHGAYFSNHVSPSHTGKVTPTANCSGCHDAVVGGSAPDAITSPFVTANEVHKNGCSTCHTANGAMKAAYGKATAMPVGGGDCNACHGAYFASHSNANHTAQVAGSASCVVCHTATAGTATTVPVDATPGSKVHDACTTCHNTTTGALLAAYGKASAMPAGGGDCAACHGVAYFDSHTHSHDVSHNPAVDLSQAAPGTACRNCHDDANLGKGTLALSTWAAIKSEHLNACGTCHSYTNADAQNSPPLTATQNAIATGVGVTCVTCHTEKMSPATHGGHTSADFGFAGNCATCHTATDIVGTVHKGTCGDCHVDPAGGGTLRSLALGHLRTDTCTTCHTDKANSFFNHTVAHATRVTGDATCTGCHTATAGTATTMPVSAADNKVHDDCATCHVEATGALRTPYGKASAIALGSCVTCHGAYFASHVAINHTTRVAATTDCATCHTATAGTASSVPVSDADNKVHDNCAVCHNANGGLKAAYGKASAMPAGGGDCVACHGAYFSNHVNASHTGKVTPTTNCSGCHDAVVGGSAADAITSPFVTANEVHKNGCTTCHTANGAMKAAYGKATAMPVGGGDCNACHGAYFASHSNANHTAQVAGSASCVVCHTGTAGTATTVPVDATPGSKVHDSCTTCHNTTTGALLAAYGKASAMPAGGGDCAACHGVAYFDSHTHSHDVSHNPAVDLSQAAPGTSCRNCHDDANLGKGTLALSTWAAIKTEHRNACGTCHSYTNADGQNSPPLTATQNAIATGVVVTCVTCHTEKVSPAVHGLHTSADFGFAGNCATCHTGTDIVATIHKGNCGDCHVNPAGGGTLRSLAVGHLRTDTCTACHTDKATSFFNHTVAHATRVTGDATCTGCHTATAGTATTIPLSTTDNKVHDDCATCHVEATGALRTPYGKATAIALGSCVTCHGAYFDSHVNINHTTRVAGTTNCTACHTATAGSATSVPVSGADNKVHDNCSVCHTATGALKAAYGKATAMPAGGGDCNACHGDYFVNHVNANHTTRVAGTANCVSCHTATAGTASTVPVNVTDNKVHDTCTTCHNGTTGVLKAAYGTAEFMPATGGDCVACHGAYFTKHKNLDLSHTTRVTGSPNCTGCHDAVVGGTARDAITSPFTASGQVHGNRGCNTCHSAAGALLASTTMAPGLAAGGGSCVTCHGAYFPNHTAITHLTRVAETAACITCHTATAGTATTVPVDGTPGTKVHDACVTCHDVNTGAYRTAYGKASAMPAGGGDCAACHGAAYFTSHTHTHAVTQTAADLGQAAPGSLCSTCHIPSPAGLTTWDSVYAEHVSDCTKCHSSARTEVITAIAAKANPTHCLNCHSAKATPAVHALHTTADFGYSGNCNTCHTGTDIVGTVHKGKCGDCHVNPAGGGTLRSLALGHLRTDTCTTCHTDKATSFFNHTVAHVTYVTGDATCTGCHTATAGTATTIPLSTSDNKVHDNCATCHVEATGALRTPYGKASAIALGSCVTCHGAYFPNHTNVNHTAKVTSSPNCSGCHDAVVGGTARDAITSPFLGTGEVHAARTCNTCHTAAGALLAPTAMAPGLAAGGGSCVTCHGAYFANHTNITHVSRVAGAASCVVCHTATVGTATTVPVDATPGNKVHDACATCHDVTTGTYRAAYGKASAMPAGGGDCAACHGAAYFDSHTHSHDVSHNPAVDLAQAAPGTACRNCHDDANLGKGTLALSTWAAIKSEHLNACGTCHSYTNADGYNSPPLLTTQNAIAAGGGVTCLTCHTEKALPAIHAAHTDADFAFAGNCANCHGGSGINIVTDVHKNNCGNCHVNPAGSGTLRGSALGHLRTDSCTTCHTDKAASFFNHTVAHAPMVAGDASCDNCHTATAGTATTMPVSAADNKVHDGCATCHVEATGALRIAYGKATAMAPGSCLTCHGVYFDSHSNINHTVRVGATANCSACHGATAGTTTSVPVSVADNKVHDSCAVCHDANGGLRAAYGKAIALPVGGGDCNDCHGDYFVNHDNANHTTRVGGASDCIGCHTATAGTAVTVPVDGVAGNKVHDACTTCHDGITGELLAAYGKAIAMPATGGDCVACHGAYFPNHANVNHTGKVATSANCTTCHDAVAGGSAPNAITTPYTAAGEVHAVDSCNTCHAANGSLVAATTMAPGIAAGGGTCETCHGSYFANHLSPDHAAKVAPTTDCVTCHTATAGTATGINVNSADNKVHDACSTCHNTTTGALLPAGTPTTLAVTAGNAWTQQYAYAPAAASGNNVSAGSITVAGTTGSNRIFLVAIAMEDATTPAVAIPTISARLGGVALTAIGTGSTASANATVHTWMGYLKDAQIPAGSNVLDFSFNNNTQNVTGLHVKWASYANVDQTTPINDSAANVNNATTATVTFGSQVDYLAQGLTVLVAANGATSSTYTQPTGFNAATAVLSGNSFYSVITQTANHATAANFAGTLSMAFSSTTYRTSTVVASLRPATGSIPNYTDVTAIVAGDCVACHGAYFGSHQAVDHTGKVATSSNCSGCHDALAGGTARDAITAPYTAAGQVHAARSCNTCHSTGGALLAPSTMAPGLAAGGGTCVTCHAAYFVNHSNITHLTRVAGAAACTTCHTATAGTATTVPVDATPGNKVHDACATCHDVATGAYRAAYGKASAMPAGGGDCTVCHGATYFDSHTHSHDVSHNPAVDVAQAAPGSACRNCHDDANLGKGTLALSTWAAIKSEHLNACATCHGYTNGDGKNSPPLAANQTAIATGVGVTCVTCHTEKTSPATHGSHTSADFAYSGNCNTCHTGTDIVVTVHKGKCGDCHVNPAGGGTLRSYALGHLRSDNCTTCHTDKATSFFNHTVAHATYVTGDATCDACHTATAGTATTMPVNPADNKVHDACATCHVEATGALRTPYGKASAMALGSCLTCHGAYFDSHVNINHTTRVAVTTNCTTCHPATAGTATTVPVSAADNKVHDSCSTCHTATGTLKAAYGKASAMPVGGGDCNACHGAYFASHVNANHTARVAPTATCVVCHTGTAGTATGVPVGADPKLHSACDSCHNNTTGVLLAAYGKAPGLAAGGGTCATCHLNYFPNHTHSHTVIHDPLTDLAQAAPGTACRNCHDDANLGTGIFALSTWNSILTEHLSDCNKCHSSARPDVIAAITAKANPTKCLTCHLTKQSPNGHGGHPQPEAIAMPAAVCVNCHDNDANNPKAVVTDIHKGVCTNCHTSPPTLRTLPVAGVVAITRGGDCETCHGAGYGHTVSNPTHSKIVFGNDGGTNSTCINCHDANPITEHVTIRGWFCAICHQTPVYNTIIANAIASPTATVYCTDCHVTQTFPHGSHNHTIANLENCVACHGGTNPINDIHVPGMVAGNGADLTCDTCHSSVNPTIVNAIAAHTATCATCHATRYQHTVVGQHTISTVAPCNTCHTAATVTFDQVVTLHRDTCATCHGSTDPTVVGVINTGGAVTCTSCHTGTAGTVHHANNHAKIGECEWCHSTPKFSAWNTATPGDNGGTSLYPTQLGCVKCHVTFSGGTMTVLKFADHSKTDYSTDFVKSTQHQIAGMTASTINSYEMCMSCHYVGSTKVAAASQVKVYHAKPTWTPADTSGNRGSCGTGTGIYAPGRSSSTISKFLIFRADFWPTATRLFSSSGCRTTNYTPNNYTPANNPNGTFMQIVVPNVTQNGNVGSTVGIPVLASVTKQTAADTVKITQAWWTETSATPGTGRLDLQATTSATGTVTLSYLSNTLTKVGSHYELTLTGIAMPTTVTVNSTVGGSALATVSNRTCTTCSSGGVGTVPHPNVTNIPVGNTTLGICTDCHSGKLDAEHKTRGYSCTNCHGNGSGTVYVPAHIQANISAAGYATITAVVAAGVANPANVSCVTCHGSPSPHHVGHDATAHDVAFQAVDQSSGVACTSCHRRGGTRSANPLFSPTWSGTDGIYALHQLGCGECHNSTRYNTTVPGTVNPAYGSISNLITNSTGTIHCLDCHEDRAIRHGGHLDTDFGWSGNCANCHTGANIAMDVHKGNCTTCHVSSLGGGPLTGRAVGHLRTDSCTVCHTDKAASFFNHTVAHENRVMDEPNCATCHPAAAGTATTIAVNPADNKVHHGCASCHDEASGALLTTAVANKAGTTASVVAMVAGDCVECHGAYFSSHGNITHTARVATTANCSACHTATAGTATGIPVSAADNKVHDSCATCHDTLTGTLRAAYGKATAMVAGDCNACHGAYFVNHVNANHTTRVAALASCVTCHTATAGTATTVPVSAADNKVHDVCTTCHNGTNGALLAAYGKATAMPVGGGDCAACHGAYFPNHIHTHTVVHNTTTDLAQAAPGTACRNCHDDANLGKGTLALSTWAAIKTEHLNDCNLCHSSGRAEVTMAIAAKANPTKCLNCHSAKATPATHGGHPQPEAIAMKASACIDCHDNDVDNPKAVVAGIHKGVCTNCHTTPPTLRTLPIAGVVAITRGGDCETCHGINYGHTVSNPTHGKIIFGNDGGTNSGCTGCHDANPITEHVTIRGWFCGICHQSPIYNTIIETAIASPTATVYCTDCHVTQTFPHGSHTHNITNLANCAVCHGGTNPINDIHVPGMVAGNGANLTCDTCHASAVPAIVNAIAANSATCATCHAARYQHNAVGVHTISTVAPCNTCHTAATVTFDQVVTLHRDTCATCHGSTDPTVVSVIATGGAVSCTSCHTGTAGTVHHANNHAKIGECEWCHSSPKFSSWNTATPGDNGGTSLYPTQLACKGCHVTFAAGTMTITKFADHSKTDYSADFVKTTQHQIAGMTASNINSYEMCMSCHYVGSTKVAAASQVKVFHGKPTWTPLDTTGNRGNCGTSTGVYAPGRASSTISKFLLFRADFWPTATRLFSSSGCRTTNYTPNNYTPATNPNVSFIQVVVPNVAQNGSVGSTVGVPVLQSVTKQVGADTVTITQAWWTESTTPGIGTLSLQATSSATLGSVTVKYLTNNFVVSGNHYELTLTGVAMPTNVTVTSTGGGSKVLAVSNRSCTTCSSGGAGTVPHPNVTNINSGDATSGICTDCHNGKLDTEHKTRGFSCTTCHGNDSGTVYVPAAIQAKIVAAGYANIGAVVAAGVSNPANVTCATCHGLPSALHANHDANSHDVALAGTDLSGGAACNTCHRRGGTGSANPKFAATWGGTDGIYALHQLGCNECHASTRYNTTVPGTVNPAYGSIANVIANHTTTVGCLDCHVDRGTAHGGHTVTDFGYSGNCSTCHTGADIVATIHKGTCGSCHVNPAGGGTLKSLALGHLRTDTCTTCHTDKATSFFNHTVAHSTRVTGDASCNVCHTGAIGTATTIPVNPADNKVHDACSTCHIEATGALRTPYGKASAMALGSCVTCHGAYFNNHVNITHTARVAGAASCITCHTATAGTATTVPVDGVAGNKVHDACSTCHSTTGTLKAAYGKAIAMPAGGGDCVACHGTYFPNHTHSHTVSQNATDLGQAAPGALCSTCHIPSPAGLITWASVYAEHLSDCTKCHSSARAEVITAISAKANPTKCLNCHSAKATPATHGGHSATDFAWTPATTTSCGAAACHNAAANTNVITNLHKGTCTFCHTTMSGGDGTTILGARNNGDARLGDTITPHVSGCLVCHSNGTTIVVGGIHHDTASAANNDCTVTCHSTTRPATHATRVAGDAACTSCHTATVGSATGVPVSPTDPQVHDSCRTCHTFNASTYAGQLVAPTGNRGVTAMPVGGGACTVCHTAAASTIHHGNAHAAIGECEWCHSTPKFSSWNTATPGDNGGTSLYPTQMACKQCHVTFVGGVMTVTKFADHSKTDYSTDFTKTTQHQISGMTASNINSYEMCMSCHYVGSTKVAAAAQVKVYHAKPTWTPADTSGNRGTCGTGMGVYAPGRASSTISKFLLFRADFWPTATRLFSSSGCRTTNYTPNNYTPATNPNVSFVQVVVPNVAQNGATGNTVGVPILQSITKQTTTTPSADTVKVTAATWVSGNLNVSATTTNSGGCSTLTVKTQPDGVSRGTMTGTGTCTLGPVAIGTAPPRIDVSTSNTQGVHILGYPVK